MTQDPADKVPDRPTRPAFFLRNVATYTVDASLPAFQWKQMTGEQQAAAVAGMQANMLLTLRQRYPGRFYDLLDPIVPGGENGALTIGQGKLLQRAMPVKFVAAIYAWVVVRPVEERGELAALAAAVLGDDADAWLAGLDRILAAWPEAIPQPVVVPAGAN